MKTLLILDATIQILNFYLNNLRHYFGIITWTIIAYFNYLASNIVFVF